MRTIATFIIALLGVLIYALVTQAFASDSRIFFLGALAAGLIGYLIADQLFKMRTESLRQELASAKKQTAAVQKRLEDTAKSEAIEDAADNQTIHDLRARVAELENERNDASSKAMQLTTELGALTERHQRAATDLQKLQEDSAADSSISSTESMAVQDALAKAKAKLTEVAAENDRLAQEVAQLRAQIDSQPSESVNPVAIVEPEPVAEAAEKTDDLKVEQNGLSIAEKMMSAPVIALKPVAELGGVDNLTAIEGIGPKISILLKENGISTWNDLASTSIVRLRDILQIAGGNYVSHNPETWPEQAQLLVSGEFDKFKELNSQLRNGKRNDNLDV